MPRPWESLAMFRALGAKERIAYSLRLLGHAVRLQSDLERAPGLYRESLALFGETGDKWVAPECIEELALVAGTQAHSERAARLFGVAEATREAFCITRPRCSRVREPDGPRGGSADDPRSATLGWKKCPAHRI
jgi:hypothetical protein